MGFLKHLLAQYTRLSSGIETSNQKPELCFLTLLSNLSASPYSHMPEKTPTKCDTLRVQSFSPHIVWIRSGIICGQLTEVALSWEIEALYLSFPAVLQGSFRGLY